MKNVSRGNFLKVSGGVTKPKDGKRSQSYFIVNLLDDEKENYRFFVFEGTDLYKKLQTNPFQFLQELIITTNISNYNNVANLGDLEVSSGK